MHDYNQRIQQHETILLLDVKYVDQPSCFDKHSRAMCLRHMLALATLQQHILESTQSPSMLAMINSINVRIFAHFHTEMRSMREISDLWGWFFVKFSNFQTEVRWILVINQLAAVEFYISLRSWTGHHLSLLSVTASHLVIAYLSDIQVIMTFLHFCRTHPWIETQNKSASLSLAMMCKVLSPHRQGAISLTHCIPCSMGLSYCQMPLPRCKRIFRNNIPKHSSVPAIFHAWEWATIKPAPVSEHWVW
jgi:hypothetical protein